MSQIDSVRRPDKKKPRVSEAGDLFKAVSVLTFSAGRQIQMFELVLGCAVVSGLAFIIWRNYSYRRMLNGMTAEEREAFRKEERSDLQVW